MTKFKLCVKEDRINDAISEIPYGFAIGLYKTAYKQYDTIIKMMKERDCYLARNIVNLRYDCRFYRIECVFDYSDPKNPKIYIDEFRELDLDSYLDNLLMNKTLSSEGYIQI